MQTITNYHRLSGLSNEHLFFPILETESLRSRCKHGWVIEESILFGLQMAIFLLCPHMASGERKPLSSSYKDANSIMWPPPSTPISSPKTPLQVSSHRRVGLQYNMNLGERGTIQSIANSVHFFFFILLLIFLVKVGG